MATNTVLEPTSPPLVAQKFSRYRSVRQASREQPAAVPPVEASSPQNASIARSQSRYHRGQPRNQSTSPRLPSSPPAFDPALAARAREASLAALTGESVSPVQSPSARSPHREPPDEPKRRRHPSQATGSYGSSSKMTTQMALSYDAARQEARDILRSEEERLRRLRAQQNAAREAQMAERTRKRALEQAQADAAASAKPITDDPKTNNSPEEQVPENAQGRPRRSLVIGRSSEAPDPAATPEAGQSLLTRMKSASKHKPADSNAKSSSRTRKLVIGSPRPVSEATEIRGFKPQTPPGSMGQTWPEDANPKAFDAPISAVNAGERRVFVQCDKSSIALPVTPTTTARDLINAASICMSESIDPQNSVLVEGFAQLGLERHIRTYEHIRDVLNSWEHDAQHTLVITPTGEDPEDLLDARKVPKSAPADVSFILYHSQNPRKWNKRCINLRTDGQMTISKRPGEADSTNICHLSDFDIYTPTPRQIKKIKPPKKMCFAIKSQEKSAMFLEGANYVHFISTSDKAVGKQFCRAVQLWRSWYLVNQLGEGQKMQAKPSNAIEAMQRPSTASSTQSTPYQLGSFKPLLDFDLGQMNLNDSKHTATLHRRNLLSRDRRAPPSAFPAGRREDANQGSPVPVRDRSGSFNGRPGSTASNNEPPSSLGRGASVNRGNSTRHKNKPFIDLASQFQEQPHQLRIGRGVKAPDGQLLIDLATDAVREPDPIGAMPAYDWRRPNATYPPTGAGGFPQPTGDEEENQGFTGGGLLARDPSKRAQGAHSSGRGVKGVDGKPLIDLHLGSKFADGSLLRQVEAWSGADERGLVIDRVKRIEKSVKVGEGF